MPPPHCHVSKDLSATGGIFLDCSRTPDHAGLHHDSDYGLWWATEDSGIVTAGGRTTHTAETGVIDKIANAVGGLGEDIGLSADDWSMRTCDMLEQLAARIRDGA